MTFRPGPLKAAAALAAGFIVVRVVYRVLFHGVSGTGAVLLPLPELRLPPPFAHVVMFGAVTADGLWVAALSAVPIAATILAFGLLNAVLDLPRLFARGARRGPFRGLARMLSIAWATLPALADAVRAARFAQRLRGERGGARLLAPVLQRTLERATAVAAALELRGYAGRGLPGDCTHPVDVREAAFGFGATPTLRIDALALSHGTLTVLSGPTGSGKSTLLRALSGLHAHVDGGRADGVVQVVGHDRTAVPPRDTARTVGVVLQHPRDAFATERVADEIGLALELRGVAPVIVADRVREVAERVGIASLLDRRLRTLSAGEATLVAIAAAVAEHPILLLVDEPLADLDLDARARIVHLLDALAHEAGLCVVVAEHRAAEFAGVADTWLRVEEGTVRVAEDDTAERAACATPPIRAGKGVPEPFSPASTADRLSSERPAAQAVAARVPAALAVSALTVRHGDRIAVREAALSLAPGEIVALTGPNGAGKSSLLAALAEQEKGVALVPDASDDLFVRDTVAAECRRADTRAQRAHRADTRAQRAHRAEDAAATGIHPTTVARFAALLGLAPDDPALARRLALHPRDLSAGERRCLAIALQTARRPAVLMIDEPTRGLDPRARDLVGRAIISQADAGVAVLLATHDLGFADAVAGRALAMRAGVVGAAVAVDAAIMPATSRRTPRMSPPAGESPVPGRSREIEIGVAADTRGRTVTGTARRTRGALHAGALVAANLAAAAAFLWPLVASAVPAQAHAAVPYIALALAPLAVLLVFATLDGTVRSAHTLALLAVLAAIGAAIRVASTGVGGVEALFVLLILAGRAYGARFGLLLGASALALSAVVWGGVGPWLPFQMFACGWIGAGAGLLPRLRGWAEVALLCVYGVVASYLFGLIMNMWFWPFAVGAGTSISYVPGGSVGENLANFLVYSLLTSTLSWDTLRAVTTVIGLVLVGRAILGSLRRAKPLAPASGRRG